MASDAAQSNPDWSWDEQILAFDLYRRIGMAGNSHPEVIELSSLLRSLPIHSESVRTASFRNPNGVARKLADIGTRDPAHPERKKSSGSRLDERIWEEFDGSGLFASIAERIRTASAADLEPIGLELESREGTLVMRMHLRRERDRSLVRRKKEAVLSKSGVLACEACDSIPAQIWGHDLTEVHHLRPLSSGETVTKLNDLAILCPTCHRAAHRIEPWPTIGELRDRWKRPN